ncbi:MAG: sulfatase-like hydrolase/transferase [Phycisphaeraceae bacterium]|nr:sulfatase-like hydrolase/transferase [Phycisphaeraceae bacterium]
MATSDKPNIIYILGDDHRADFLSCAGHPVLRTPNLDQLAKDGTRFTNAFCTSPLCTPSRTCHYTGQWERKHGVNFNSDSSVAPAAWENSFPMRLKDAGYYLGWVGKNHVPVGQGGYDSGYLEKAFDYWYGNHRHTGFYPKELKNGGKIYHNAQADTQVEVFEQGVMNFLQPTKPFIENGSPPLPVRPKNQPFCLCVTFNLPHGASTNTMQMRPTDDLLYRETYRDKMADFRLPDTYMGYGEAYETPRFPKHVYNGRYIPSYDYVRTPQAMIEHMVRVCQTITAMDRMLGHLRQTLKELGLADNTIIVFSTDHGIHHGEHGIGGKSFLYEEDIRIPLIICDPRADKSCIGQTRDELVVVPDLAPTVLDLAEVPTPTSMQGSSLTPLLRRQQVTWRDEFFTEQLMDIQNYPRSESVRTHDWKYIRYFKRHEDPTQASKPYRGTLDNYITCLSSTLEDESPIYEELYHLRDDPQERFNLAGKKSHQSQLTDMRTRIQRLGREAKGDNSPPLTLAL